MSMETWIIILGITGINLSTFVGGLIHITNRLTKIETDLKWVIKNCDRCQPTLDNHSK